MTGAELEKLLDRLKLPELYSKTPKSLEPDAIRAALWKKQETQSLLQHSVEVIPILLRRLESLENLRDKPKVLIYFLIMERCGDSRAVPAIIRYLGSLPDSEEECVASALHPFRYAVDALSALIPIHFVAPSSQECFRQRHMLVAQGHAFLLHQQKRRPQSWE